MLEVILTTYYGGNWAKCKIERATIIPQYFKNGNLIKSKFKVVNVLEEIQKGYQPRNSRANQVITEVIKEM